MKSAVAVDQELSNYLGQRVGQVFYKEKILLIGPVWIMTREHPSGRTEWFAYKGLEMIIGKAQVEPLLLEKGHRPQVEWLTKRDLFTNGSIDTITWKRGQKSGNYQVGMLENPPDFCRPACPKHWKVLASLEPMLFEQFAEPEIKSLL